jgi:hypothetical protein
VAYVVPMQLDSLNAAQVLLSLGIKLGMIHLYGGHDYDPVSADLRAWWALLTPEGMLIGDDYYFDGMWGSVRKPFHDFFSGQGVPISSASQNDARDDDNAVARLSSERVA